MKRKRLVGYPASPDQTHFTLAQLSGLQRFDAPPRFWPRVRFALRTAWLILIAALLLALVCGCQGYEGFWCNDHQRCRAGLVCVKTATGEACVQPDTVVLDGVPLYRYCSADGGTR